MTTKALEVDEIDRTAAADAVRDVGTLHSYVASLRELVHVPIMDASPSARQHEPTRGQAALLAKGEYSPGKHQLRPPANT